MGVQSVASAPASIARQPVRFGVLGDERLARLAGSGNAKAFATLYERHHDALFKYCRWLVRNDADAQDVLQSTFEKALGALKRGQRDAPVRPWLFRIAHNESISLMRRRRVVEELPDTLESSSSVEDLVAQRASLTMLVADLMELPERQRGALLMRELSGLSHEEIAASLGISVGAAKQTVFQARRTLMELSEGRAMPCDEIQRVVSDGDGRVLQGRRVSAHLRECTACAAFAASIPDRQVRLRALSPALPPAVAAGVFARIVGAGAGHAGAGSGGALVAGGAANGSSGGFVVGGAAKAVGAAISAKTMAVGVAVLATATVATVGAIHRFAHAGRQPVNHGLVAAHRRAAVNTLQGRHAQHHAYGSVAGSARVVHHTVLRNGAGLGHARLTGRHAGALGGPAVTLSTAPGRSGVAHATTHSGLGHANSRSSAGKGLALGHVKSHSTIVAKSGSSRGHGSHSATAVVRVSSHAHSTPAVRSTHSVGSSTHAGARTHASRTHSRATTTTRRHSRHALTATRHRHRTPSPNPQTQTTGSHTQPGPKTQAQGSKATPKNTGSAIRHTPSSLLDALLAGGS
jgi:RNA polymerase sigma factor (sigma-70 family)